MGELGFSHRWIQRKTKRHKLEQFRLTHEAIVYYKGLKSLIPIHILARLSSIESIASVEALSNNLDEIHRDYTMVRFGSTRVRSSE